MIVAQNGDENVLEITDSDFETVENALSFCYGFPEDVSSDIDELIETLKFSSKYEIKDLNKEIEFKLIPQLSNENICKISNAVIEFNSECLKAVCQTVLLAKYAKMPAEIEKLDENFVKDIFHNVFIDQGKLTLPFGESEGDQFFISFFLTVVPFLISWTIFMIL
uniref:BTB domain-containing protein n=1 Tax=Panagrolaimus sp. PS1159 TaxID=55785 RepID=A0AC35GNC9_9BILA